jgi:hypothetical protein
MKRLAIIAALFLAAAIPARAESLVGFLAQCTAFTTTSCTEPGTTGYARQPIAFSDLSRTGVANNRVPYTFGQLSPATTITAHAVFDAATGGNLVAVLPTPSATPTPDQGDVGALSLTIPAANGLASPLAFNATYAAGATIGTTSGGNVTAAVPVAFTRGLLAAVTAASDPAYTVNTPTTGFTFTVPARTSVVILTPAGTLATGTLTLPAAPVDGQRVELLCSATVTALTVAANAGQTLSGTVTTCTASAGHIWRYRATNTTWYTLQ